MPPSCGLTPRSSSVLIHNRHHARIDSLHVHHTDASTPAVHCRYSKHVRLHRLLVEHPANGVGILFEHCHNITIAEVVVVAIHKESTRGDGKKARVGPCSLAPGPGSFLRECDNIHGIGSSGAVIDRVRVQGGSTGIELHGCHKARLRSISARNMRGPYPRGQCVQFSQCDASSLSDFYCRNEANRSWPEDSISVWRSAHVSVRDGLVDGNNAPNGVGIMFENDRAGATGGVVADVDAVRMGGGCFSGYPARELRMERVRCGWNHCTGSGGREKPNSGGQMWAAGRARNGLGSSGIIVDDAQYWSPCDAARPVTWQAPGMTGSSSAYARIQIRKARFTPRTPVAKGMRMCWEGQAG